MGLPQVSSGCLAEEVAASRIASISNYELNLLATEEDFGNRVQIHTHNSERKDVLELSKESHISNSCKDDRSNIQKLKIDSMEQIGRLSVNAEQTMQTPTSRTIGFQVRALTPHVNGFGGNGYSSTVFNVTNDSSEASESQVRKRLLSPLNGTLLTDHLKGDPLDIGGGIYQSCSKAGDDNYTALHGNYNNIHSTIWSSSCLQELMKSSSCVNHRSHCEHEEPISYKHFKSSPALNDSGETTKTKSQTAALSIPHKKVSSPRVPLSPLGKKSCTNKKLEGCRDIDIMLDGEQSLDRTCQGILSPPEMPSKSLLNSNSMRQKSDLFTPDNIIDMNEYWTYPASFPPQHTKLCGPMSRLPIRRSLVGSFEESLLSGRLLSGKVSQVGVILIYRHLLSALIS